MKVKCKICGSNDRIETIRILSDDKLIIEIPLCHAHMFHFNMEYNAFIYNFINQEEHRKLKEIQELRDKVESETKILKILEGGLK